MFLELSEVTWHKIKEKSQNLIGRSLALISDKKVLIATRLMEQLDNAIIIEDNKKKIGND